MKRKFRRAVALSVALALAGVLSAPAVLAQFVRAADEAATEGQHHKGGDAQTSPIAVASLRGASSAANGVSGAADTRRERGVTRTTGGVTAPPAFTTDPAHPYAHPYYWAPFILMGNWL
jgi:CHAT domain-containing protein